LIELTKTVLVVDDEIFIRQSFIDKPVTHMAGLREELLRIIADMEKQRI
jgi:hypothetical protein